MSRRRGLRRPVLISTVHGKLSKGQRRGLILIGVALLLFLCFLNFSSRLIPVMTEMAVNEAYERVTAAVHRAVGEKLADGTVSYSRLVELERDAAGGIAALVTDMAAINTLQAQVVSRVVQEVSEPHVSSFRIPLGNLMGGGLFSGRGPGIRFRVLSLGNPTAVFSNEFSAAGINQTKHQILLTLDVQVKILVPGNAVTETITTQVLVAETVIVGEVPDSYINLE